MLIWFFGSRPKCRFDYWNLFELMLYILYITVTAKAQNITLKQSPYSPNEYVKISLSLCKTEFLVDSISLKNTKQQ